jgi:hypothetical protein
MKTPAEAVAGGDHDEHPHPTGRAERDLGLPGHPRQRQAAGCGARAGEGQVVILAGSHRGCKQGEQTSWSTTVRT